MAQTAGARLRASVLGIYELDAGELILLDQAVALCDTLDRVNVQVEALKNLTDVGSAGQIIEHPLLRAQRSYSLALAKLVDALRLPAPGAGADEEGESKITRDARRAARARWNKEKELG